MILESIFLTTPSPVWTISTSELPNSYSELTQKSPSSTSQCVKRVKAKVFGPSPDRELVLSSPEDRADRDENLYTSNNRPKGGIFNIFL